MKHILVPLDGSDHAFKALDVALDLAEHHNAKITLVNVTPSRDIPEGLKRFAEVEHIEQGAEWLYDKTVGERIVAAARQHAANRSPRSLQVSVHSGDAAEAICAAAKDLGADAIVMGTRGLSDFAGLVMGSVSRRVSHGAPCTVITVR